MAALYPTCGFPNKAESIMYSSFWIFTRLCLSY
jgi:hypothetical protein